MSLILTVKLLFKKTGKINDFVVIALLFLTGGFLFHTFWETKSQYVWQYISLLIPLASFEINELSGKATKKFKLVKLSIRSK